MNNNQKFGARQALAEHPSHVGPVLNQRKSLSRKVIPWGLLLICVGVCSTSFGQYGGGNGTSTAPNLIYTASQFNAIGAHTEDWDECFKLMADIDLSAYTGTQYNRIGIDDKHPFTGVLDGNGHIISNLTYDAADTNNVGLVGYLDSSYLDPTGVIKNLGIVGAHVTGNQYVGGLVGYNSGKVIHCYSYGSVSGTAVVGGLVGRGDGPGSIENSFWDVQTSGQSQTWITGHEGEGKTTAEMQDFDTYFYADWELHWVICDGKDYPRLWWENPSCN